MCIRDSLEGALRRGRAAEALHQVVGLVDASPHAETKDDLRRVAVDERDLNLERGARAERGAGAARQSSPRERGGSAQRTVAADELGAVAGEAAAGECSAVDVEEADPVGVVVAIGIARVDRAGVVV